jgi:hypothetical protein
MTLYRCYLLSHECSNDVPTIECSEDQAALKAAAPLKSRPECHRLVISRDGRFVASVSWQDTAD